MKREFVRTWFVSMLSAVSLLAGVSSTAAQTQPPDLSLSMNAPPTASVNVNFSYPITVSNIGAGPATGVIVTDVLPPGLSFVSTGSSAGCAPNGAAATGVTVTCPAGTGTIAAGASAVVTIVVVTPTGGTILNVAGAVANEADSTMSNNSATGSTAVSAPPAPALSSLSLFPANPAGGATTVGTVTLTLVAPVGGASVTLSTSDATLAVAPTSVIVPAGALFANFTVATSVVGANRSCTVSGVYLAVTKQATLTAIPITPSYTNYAGTPNTTAFPGADWEVGTEFYADKNGWVTGVRFYKLLGESVNPAHIGRLWNGNTTGAVGPPLGTATFQSETAEGWQEAELSSPVYILAGQTYVVSYGSNVSITKYGLAIANAPPLYSTRGCYVAGRGNPPACNVGATPDSATNFWVDVRFRPATKTIFNLQLPQTPAPNGGSTYENATRFSSSQDGLITALRFFKVPTETGSHTGRLWKDDGTLLATVTFTSETAAGWQEKTLTTSYAVTAGLVYRVSYTSNTQTAKTTNGLASDVIDPPLTASDGYFGTPGGIFPTNLRQDNFFADIRFSK